jgi:hypothetical protein
MDEAFMPFSSIIARMMAFGGGHTDEEAGVRSYITACEIESPVELDITRDAEGRLQIGTTPPIYCLMTSVVPSFHRLRFTTTLSGEGNGRL